MFGLKGSSGLKVQALGFWGLGIKCGFEVLSALRFRKGSYKALKGQGL